MKIIIKWLRLTNFKGIRSFEVTFKTETTIFGRNASGKTTLMDADTWLKFGKDSVGRKDFELKTLDENNQPYHNLDHEVAAIYEVDGKEITIRRVFKENWQKKRGTSVSEFTGHTTEYYWNDVPLKEKEFQAKIDSIINENLFKLITNPYYFNSMKWQDRRNVLISIAGEISNAEVLDQIANVQNKTQIGWITNELNRGKTIDECKRELAAKKKGIKDQLDVIPIRIQEQNNAMPEPVNYDEIEKNLTETKEEILSIDQMLQNKSKALKDHQDNIMLLMKQRQEKQTELFNLENSIKNQVLENRRSRESNIQDQKLKLRTATDNLSRARTEYSNKKNELDSITKQMDDKRAEWAKVNDEQLVFNDDDFCCPTCKRAFEQADINSQKETLTENFNSNKSTRLAKINQEGLQLKERADILKTELANLQAAGEQHSLEVQKLTGHISELEIENTRLISIEDSETKGEIINNKKHQSITKEIDALSTQIDAPAPEQNNTALTSRKNDLQRKVDEWNKELATKGQEEKINARIAELKQQEEKMNQELTELEGIEYAIEQFTVAKMDALEQRVNGRFSMVRFQMFEQQINGGRADACITLVNSNGSFVPYADANTAAKIQAGLDIINTLSSHYDVYAPVWVDNRESVTELPETKCQLINLVVSKKHNKLTVIDSPVLEQQEA